MTKRIQFTEIELTALINLVEVEQKVTGNRTAQSSDVLLEDALQTIYDKLVEGYNLDENGNPKEK